VGGGAGNVTEGAAGVTVYGNTVPGAGVTGALNAGGVVTAYGRAAGMVACTGCAGVGN
jgi:hypothetical protein